MSAPSASVLMRSRRSTEASCNDGQGAGEDRVTKHPLPAALAPPAPLRGACFVTWPTGHHQATWTVHQNRKDRSAVRSAFPSDLRVKPPVPRQAAQRVRVHKGGHAQPRGSAGNGRGPCRRCHRLRPGRARRLDRLRHGAWRRRCRLEAPGWRRRPRRCCRRRLALGRADACLHYRARRSLAWSKPRAWRRCRVNRRSSRPLLASQGTFGLGLPQLLLLRLWRRRWRRGLGRGRARLRRLAGRVHVHLQAAHRGTHRVMRPGFARGLMPMKMVHHMPCSMSV